jgi:hypothetical protein
LKQVDVQNLRRFCVASLLGLMPKLWASHPRTPLTLGRPPPPFVLSSLCLRNLSLFYKLALATTEQSHSAAFVYCRLHLRVIVRLLGSFSYSFFDCMQEMIFMIRLTLHQHGWKPSGVGSVIALALRDCSS